MAEIVLNAETRGSTGTGGARAARRAGLVPGVVYGGKKGPEAVAIRSNEFRKALFTGKLLGHLVTLKNGRDTQSVIAKDVQMHPVTDEPVHFDFYRVDRHQKVTVEVTVHFSNQEECPGLKKGGTLNVALHEVPITVPADQIPEELLIDIAGLEIGDNIRVADLKLPANAECTLEAETVVASVTGAMAEEVEEAPAESAEGAEGAEGAAEAGEAAAEGGESDGGEA